MCLPVFVPSNYQCMSCSHTDESCNQMSFYAACLFSAQGITKDHYKNLLSIPGNFTQEEIYDNIGMMSSQAFDGSISTFTGFTGTQPFEDPDFCDECMLLVIETNDEYDKKINEFKHQLTPTNSTRPKSTESADQLATNYGHCQDSFSIPDFEWRKLQRTPPTPLFQIYFECTDRWDNVVINSFGIAAANSAFLSGIVGMSFIMFAGWFIDNAVPQIELPDDEEKVKILERLRLYPG